MKWSFAVNTKAVFPATIARACQLAMTAPKGPVLVSLPMEFLFAAMTADAPASSAIPLPPTADPGGLDKLIGMLVEAQRPLIVTEECGRSVAAVERLVEVSELLCIPVVETRTAGYMNFPRDHFLHAGFDPAIMLQEVDFVLLLAAIAPWHPPSAGPQAGARVAILSENPLRAELPYWGYQTDLCLTGEVESALARMAEELRRRVAPAQPSRAEASKRWVSAS